MDLNTLFMDDSCFAVASRQTVHDLDRCLVLTFRFMGHRAGLFGFAAGGCFLVAPGEHKFWFTASWPQPSTNSGVIGLNMIN